MWRKGFKGGDGVVQKRLKGLYSDKGGQAKHGPKLGVQRREGKKGASFPYFCAMTIAVPLTQHLCTLTSGFMHQLTVFKLCEI